ncbi:hypothetical protein K1T71_011385 [Dendrolimus kikuchii]|uniref:Uncharacterized protein n=1 Tax=Dendrolimus kikuchii TaxID=765133 RepID=A0ACC1CNL2_9NEOP|nr:hypothetical protein K1T71_011385 [Dendrolimus kikuchii]
MGSINIVLGTFLILVLHNTSGHHESPCPETFTHKHGNGNESYGLITIRPKGPVNLVIVKANFIIQTHLPTSYQGNIEPAYPYDLERKMMTGEPIIYRVNYPLITPLLYPTSIVANGQQICFGPEAIPSPILTAITMEHILTLNSQELIPEIQTDLSNAEEKNTLQDPFTIIRSEEIPFQSNAGGAFYPYWTSTHTYTRPQYTPRLIHYHGRHN